MTAAPTPRIQTRRGENVRIGPITLIALIVVICLAVLAVLAASTSHATAATSERQAAASQQLYLNETAGQEFVAGLDGVLAGVREFGGTAADAGRTVERELDGICQGAREAAGGRVACTADVQDGTVTAEFTCDGARVLDIAITIRDDATYRIDKWKAASAQQEAEPPGALWLGA